MCEVLTFKRFKQSLNVVLNNIGKFEYIIISGNTEVSHFPSFPASVMKYICITHNFNPTSSEQQVSTFQCRGAAGDST